MFGIYNESLILPGAPKYCWSVFEAFHPKQGKHFHFNWGTLAVQSVIDAFSCVKGFIFRRERGEQEQNQVTKKAQTPLAAK